MVVAAAVAAVALDDGRVRGREEVRDGLELRRDLRRVVGGLLVGGVLGDGRKGRVYHASVSSTPSSPWSSKWGRVLLTDHSSLLLDVGQESSQALT